MNAPIAAWHSADASTGTHMLSTGRTRIAAYALVLTQVELPGLMLAERSDTKQDMRSDLGITQGLDLEPEYTDMLPRRPLRENASFMIVSTA